MVLAPQMRVWFGDDLYGALARMSGWDQPALFLLIQVATLAVLVAGGVWLMRAFGASWLATGAFLALLTLRHRIAKTGANSIEGYMHPANAGLRPGPVRARVHRAEKRLAGGRAPAGGRRWPTRRQRVGS